MIYIYIFIARSFIFFIPELLHCINVDLETKICVKYYNLFQPGGPNSRGDKKGFLLQGEPKNNKNTDAIKAMYLMLFQTKYIIVRSKYI